MQRNITNLSKLLFMKEFQVLLSLRIGEKVTVKEIQTHVMIIFSIGTMMELHEERMEIRRQSIPPQTNQCSYRTM